MFVVVAGYYQPAGPLIKESGADAERALARYHPQPHYHAPHPSVSTFVITIFIQSKKNPVESKPMARGLHICLRVLEA